jgi:hypothetical protein
MFVRILHIKEGFNSIIEMLTIHKGDKDAKEEGYEESKRSKEESC